MRTKLNIMLFEDNSVKCVICCHTSYVILKLMVTARL